MGSLRIIEEDDFLILREGELELEIDLESESPEPSQVQEEQEERFPESEEDLRDLSQVMVQSEGFRCSSSDVTPTSPPPTPGSHLIELEHAPRRRRLLSRRVRQGMHPASVCRLRSDSSSDSSEDEARKTSRRDTKFQKSRLTTIAQVSGTFSMEESDVPEFDLAIDAWPGSSSRTPGHSQAENMPSKPQNLSLNGIALSLSDEHCRELSPPLSIFTDEEIASPESALSLYARCISPDSPVIPPEMTPPSPSIPTPSFSNNHESSVPVENTPMAMFHFSPSPQSPFSSPNYTLSQICTLPNSPHHSGDPIPSCSRNEYDSMSAENVRGNNTYINPALESQRQIGDSPVVGKSNETMEHHPSRKHKRVASQENPNLTLHGVVCTKKRRSVEAPRRSDDPLPTKKSDRCVDCSQRKKSKRTPITFPKTESNHNINNSSAKRNSSTLDYSSRKKPKHSSDCLPSKKSKSSFDYPIKKNRKANFDGRSTKKGKHNLDCSPRKKRKGSVYCSPAKKNTHNSDSISRTRHYNLLCPPDSKSTHEELVHTSDRESDTWDQTLKNSLSSAKSENTQNEEKSLSQSNSGRADKLKKVNSVVGHKIAEAPQSRDANKLHDKAKKITDSQPNEVLNAMSNKILQNNVRETSMMGKSVTDISPLDVSELQVKSSGRRKRRRRHRHHKSGKQSSRKNESANSHIRVTESNVLEFKRAESSGYSSQFKDGVYSAQNITKHTSAQAAKLTSHTSNKQNSRKLIKESPQPKYNFTETSCLSSQTSHDDFKADQNKIQSRRNYVKESASSKSNMTKTSTPSFQTIGNDCKVDTNKEISSKNNAKKSENSMTRINETSHSSQIIYDAFKTNQNKAHSSSNNTNKSTPSISKIATCSFQNIHDDFKSDQSKPHSNRNDTMISAIREYKITETSPTSSQTIHDDFNNFQREPNDKNDTGKSPYCNSKIANTSAISFKLRLGGLKMAQKNEHSMRNDTSKSAISQSNVTECSSDSSKIVRDDFRVHRNRGHNSGVHFKTSPHPKLNINEYFPHFSQMKCEGFKTDQNSDTKKSALCNSKNNQSPVHCSQMTLDVCKEDQINHHSSGHNINKFVLSKSEISDISPHSSKMIGGCYNEDQNTDYRNRNYTKSTLSESKACENSVHSYQSRRDRSNTHQSSEHRRNKKQESVINSSHRRHRSFSRRRSTPRSSGRRRRRNHSREMSSPTRCYRSRRGNQRHSLKRSVRHSHRRSTSLEEHHTRRRHSAQRRYHLDRRRYCESVDTRFGRSEHHRFYVENRSSFLGRHRPFRNRSPYSGYDFFRSQTLNRRRHWSYSRKTEQMRDRWGSEYSTRSHRREQCLTYFQRRRRIATRESRNYEFTFLPDRENPAISHREGLVYNVEEQMECRTVTVNSSSVVNAENIWNSRCRFTRTQSTESSGSYIRWPSELEHMQRNNAIMGDRLVVGRSISSNRQEKYQLVSSRALNENM